ncbi:MAG: hypothetical protein IPI67_09825 [Myxococcales bacterium]|nr:hypothetical protein [Myxococcales bacterium]
MRKQLFFLIITSSVSMTLSLTSGCGSDDSSGGGGKSSGGTAGTSGSGGASTGGASGSGGSSTGGAAGAGGSNTGGAAGAGGSNTGGAAGSGGTSTGGASGSGGADAGACTAFPDAGAACNSLANGAAFVPVTQVATAVPTGTGGTIAEGLYHLTKIEGYTGNPLGSLTMKQTLEICGGVGQLVGDEQGPPVYHKSFTFTTSGTGITATTTCSTQSPNVDIVYSSYTATPTSLTLYSTAVKFSVTYTKQ